MLMLVTATAVTTDFPLIADVPPAQAGTALR
jgi:hypothetical protein